jgi:hypothetical protein
MAGLPSQLPTFWLCLAVLLFLAKHLIADFLVQTGWMAVGKEGATGWLLPLAVHAAIHAFGTLIICLALARALFWFSGVDFIVHSLLDRTKGLLRRRYAATPGPSVFWRLLGVDQTLHGLTRFIFALRLGAARATGGL